jgi:hypothetical protein
MVIVFATGPKVHGFKPADSNGILRAVKICVTASVGGEVKPSRRKILRHVKDPLMCDRVTDRQNSAVIFRSVSPRFAARCFYRNQSRELWWMNQERLELRLGAQ